jgi:uncharacterized membrane protein YidH (DUF202 family)
MINRNTAAGVIRDFSAWVRPGARERYRSASRYQRVVAILVYTCVAGVILGLATLLAVNDGGSRVMHALAGLLGAVIAGVALVASIVCQLCFCSDDSGAPQRAGRPVAISVALLGLILIIVAIRFAILA